MRKVFYAYKPVQFTPIWHNIPALRISYYICIFQMQEGTWLFSACSLKIQRLLQLHVAVNKIIILNTLYLYLKKSFLLTYNFVFLYTAHVFITKHCYIYKLRHFAKNYKMSVFTFDISRRVR